MKSLSGLIAKLALLVFFLVSAALLFGLVKFSSWRTDRKGALERGSQIIRTNYGEIEFAEAGEGPPVLIFHGAVGGYDQALLLGRDIAAAGFHVIAPSRPGYLRTPLSSGILPEQQAQLFAALLDNLQIPHVAVVGFSEGGPAAITFALRYPERTSCLVLVSSMRENRGVDDGPHRGRPGEIVLHQLTGDIGGWLAILRTQRDLRAAAASAADLTMGGEALSRYNFTKAVAKNPTQARWFTDLITTFSPLSLRETGTRNDLQNELRLPGFIFQKIAAPTLIVHGVDDRMIPVADWRRTVPLIPGAKFYEVPEAGHLVLLGPAHDAVWQEIIDFLRRNPSTVSQP